MTSPSLGISDPPEAIFDTPAGVVIVCPSGTLIRVNQAFCSLAGSEEAHLIGRPAGDMLAREDLTSADPMSAMLSANADGTEVARRILLRADGARSAVDCTCWLVRAPDGAPRYLCAIVTVVPECPTTAHSHWPYTDVATRPAVDGEREPLQEQVIHAERLRTLGQLAAGIAHEVNNPAAIVMGAVELTRKHLVALGAAVRRGDLDTARHMAERIETGLGYCESGSVRLGKVACKLAAFAGLHGGEVAAVDVNALVMSALELVANDLRHRAELVVELQELPPLHAHSGRLVLALTNLLLNAAQAINGLPARHRITVTTHAHAGTIVISVADTGVGVPPGLLDTIFEPFFSTRGPAEGTGLGLSVVNDVVRQHRGRVEVRSEPERGSTFLLHLPLANGLAPPAPLLDPARPRGRILVVDDEPLILDLLAGLLASEHEIVVAAGGAEAIAILAQDTGFDAVLCDLAMPGVDGPAVHAYLLEHAPALAARTVFITGGAFTPRAAAYMDALGRRVLIKPFTADAVGAIVRLAMAGEA